MTYESGENLIAWIIYFREAAEYNRNYIEFYIEEGKKLGITVRLLLVEDLDFGVENSEWYIRHQGKAIPYPSFAINRAIYPLLSKHLELMGIQVFNNSFVSEICNDKARTYQYLAKTGIRMVNTSFCLNSLLVDRLERVDQTTVCKAVDGHGGSQVFLMETSSSLSTENKAARMNHIITGIGKSDAVIQPLIGNRHQDLRVYVIGNEIIAAVLRTAKEGFKSNFSLGGEVRLYQLSEEEIKIVHVIMKQFDFGLVGIDFIIGDEGELIFNEIEDVVGSRMLYQCSDINIVEKYLNYIKVRSSFGVSIK